MQSYALDILREALPYIRRFKGQTFIVKLSGHVAESTAALHGLAEEIALLSQVGIKPVVVHGGGPQISELQTRLGIPVRVVGGRRITDAETLDLAKMVFAGKLNTDVIAALRRAGVKTVGLTGLDGPTVHAKRRQVQSIFDETLAREVEVDFGFVGDVTGVDPLLITTLCDKGYVPVLCSLASDDEGTVFNVNADTVAAELAIALSAAKLILLSNVDGVLANPFDPSSRLSRLTIAQCQELLASNAAKGGMRPKLSMAAAAVAGGVGCVHVVNGTRRNALLAEIFTDEGAGTMITKSPFPYPPSLTAEAQV